LPQGFEDIEESVSEWADHMSNHSNAGTQKAAAQAVAPRRVLYGLPCADCGAYFASSLKECPVCHSEERMAQSADPAAIPTTTLF
jgi:uncharacterized OB-fold protein